MEPEHDQMQLSDECIDAAIFAAVRSGSISEKELATIRRTPKTEWPTSLWFSLGLPAPDAAPISALVEISTHGTFHHVTEDHNKHPYEGDEHVCFTRIQVSVFTNDTDPECKPQLLESALFIAANGTLGEHANPPKTPWRGVIDEVGCSSRMEREIKIKPHEEINIQLDTRGIFIGTHTIPWSEVTERGVLDCFYSFAAYWNGESLGVELTSKLYNGNEKTQDSERANLLAILEEIDYIAAHSTGRYAGLSPTQILYAAGEDRSFLQKCVISMPWERARHISGPYGLTRWLTENHPESPECKTSQKKSEPEAKIATTDDGYEENQNSVWPPRAPQVAAAIFAATMQGLVTEEEIEAVNGLPPAKFPPELMIKLGFSPPQSQ